MEDCESLSILLVDDEPVVHETLGEYLLESGHTVDAVHDGAAGLRAIEDQDYDLALVDIRMPGIDGLALLEKVQATRPDLAVVIITGHGNMETAISALRLGAADFLPKPVKLLELDAVLAKTARIRELQKDRTRLKATIRGMQAGDGQGETSRHLVGESRATAEVRRQIRTAVDAGCDTILITGDTGTGKEVVAREIHFQAGDDDSPFIAVSCPALPESLVESELFGHVRGAFTGANRERTGCFEMADRGTLFLDEVADLSADAQAKLLRALETRSFRRVGGSKEIHVNMRVIAATNKPLLELAESGAFRRDLYYRLNLFAIDLLPLRDRGDDVLPIAEHFLAAYATPRGMTFDGFTETARDTLKSYAFPGNVRELRNIVERAAILGQSGAIEAEHLSIPNGPRQAAGEAPKVATEVRAVSRGANGNTEREAIVNALEAARWNRKQAARALGMPYSTLRYKIQRLDIA